MDAQLDLAADDTNPRGAARWILDSPIVAARRHAVQGWLRGIIRGDVLLGGADRDLVDALATGADSVRVVVTTAEQGEVLRPLPANAELCVATTRSLPFEDASFDVLIWLDALAADAARELVRLVRPDGTAVMSARSAPELDALASPLRRLSPIEQIRCGPSLNVVAGLEPVTPTGTGRLQETLLVAGRAALPEAIAIDVPEEVLERVAEAIDDLELKLAEADTDRHRLSVENDRLREARDLLVQVQADAAAAVELRFERKLFALEIADLEARYASAVEQAETLGQRVKDLEASTSWKVTAPLRRVTGAVRR